VRCDTLQVRQARPGYSACSGRAGDGAWGGCGGMGAAGARAAGAGRGGGWLLRRLSCAFCLHMRARVRVRPPPNTETLAALRPALHISISPAVAAVRADWPLLCTPGLCSAPSPGRSVLALRLARALLASVQRCHPQPTAIQSIGAGPAPWRAVLGTSLRHCGCVLPSVLRLLPHHGPQEEARGARRVSSQAPGDGEQHQPLHRQSLLEALL
jgi:hypothetical protein